MSIVERAIRKLQSQPATGSPTAKAPPRADKPVQIEPATPHTRPLPDRETRVDAPVPQRYAKTIRIDYDALRAGGLLPPQDQERLIANQYRQIKRPLIANAAGKGSEPVEKGNLIMIASAVPGEGKTFTSVNLALSMAREKDLEVLLVDADVAKPHISGVFGLATELGLLDALQDEALDVRSLVVGTDVERLTILPAGRRSENATELLAGSRMEVIAAQLTGGSPNRIVLFDSPPLLLTSESRVLSSTVGQVVIVVRAGATPQQAVLNALSLLAEGKSLGLVLNQSETEDGGRYYGYGSGQYGSSVPDEARPLQRS